VEVPVIVHQLKLMVKGKPIAKCGTEGDRSDMGTSFTVWWTDVSCFDCGATVRRLKRTS
jgi:hypothetical protein